MFNNIAGQKTFNGTGAQLICMPPLPSIGTLAIDVVSSSFVGSAKIKALGVNTPNGTALREVIYQKAGTSGDIAAGTDISMDMIHYVRQDGVSVYIDVTAYTSGSFTVYWSWSVG